MCEDKQGDLLMVLDGSSFWADWHATLWYIVAMDFLPKYFWSTKTRTKTSCFTSILILVIKTKTKP